MTFLFLAFCANVTFSQSPTTKYIDFNNTSGRIDNDAGFFNSASLSVASYTVPKNSQKTTFYLVTPWLAALDVNNQVRIINRMYMNANDPQIGDYTPGPWSSTGQYQENDYLFNYFYSLWEVTKSEIDYHIANYMNAGYVIPLSISDWPGNGEVSVGVSQQLAPYVDLNGNGVYEPDLGEYPDIPGGKAVYLITTDRTSYPNAGMGLEMHFMFYQFNYNNVLANTTFLNLKVINKSTMNYHDLKMSFYVDPDIGGFTDDFIGSDTLLNMSYAYNGDDLDENGIAAIGYGANPPAQGIMSLSHKMSASMYYIGVGPYPYNDPESITEFWNQMNGLWRDGSPMGYGGGGFYVDSLHPQTTYMFTGDPETSVGWSELNFEPINNPGQGFPPGDRRFLMTMDLGDLSIGESKCSDFAFVTSYTGGDHLANVTSLKSACTYIKQLYDADESFPCRKFYLSTDEIEMVDFSIKPNPNTGTFTIDTKNVGGKTAVQVISLTGEVVYSAEISQQSHKIQLNVEAGLYLVRIQTENGQITKRIVIE